MYKTTLSILILSIFFTSCCTLTQKRSESVLIAVQQEEADIIIDGYACGKAPLRVDLDKRYNHTIEVLKPGYQKQEAKIESCRSWQLGYNGTSPVIGAVAGTVYAGAIYGANGMIPPILIGTFTGAILGSGVGIVGILVDYSLRSDCVLDTHAVHFNLLEEMDKST